MTSLPIVTHFSNWRNHLPALFRENKSPTHTDQHTLWLSPKRPPLWVTESDPATRLLELPGTLPRQNFPERNLQRN